MSSGSVVPRLKRLARAAGVPLLLDITLSPLTLLGLAAARLLRRVGIENTPVTRWLVDRIGVLPVADQYYEPLVIPRRHLSQDGLRRLLPGIDLPTSDAPELLEELGGYGDEFERIVRAGRFDPHNGFIGRADAAILYTLVRHLRPRRVIEVGAGHSSRLVSAALEANAADGRPGRHLCIEPYENPWLEALGVDVDRRKVEDVESEMFAELSAHDILFIDSSHVIRPGGDVLRLFLEVIPKLQSGVVVHVHDIFTPDDYPWEWLDVKRRLWNEQYLLEALQSGGDRFEVLLPVHALHESQPAALARVVGDDTSGGSLWLRVR